MDNPIVEIKIVNWEKYNPRKDVRTTRWFRLENQFCFDPKFFDLSNDYKMIWIWILCYSSQEYSAVVKINPMQVGAFLSVGSGEVLDCLKKLEKRNVITIRNGHVTGASRTYSQKLPTEQDITRQDVTRQNSKRVPKNDVTDTDGYVTKSKPNPTGKASRSPLKSKLKFDDSDFSLAERWAKYASEKQPWRDFDTAKFAEAIGRVRKSVGLNSAQMVGLFEFASTHEFWADNVISPAGLLRKSSRNDLRKIDNLLAEMKRKCDKVQAVSDWVENGGDETFDPFQGVR